jgi:hypothetical protein
VKATSILTIAHIARAAETEFYAETLLNKQYPEKAYAMWAINDAADQRAIDSVLEYFRINRSKLKNGKLTNGTVVDGLEFLGRYVGQDKRISDFFTETELFWDKLVIGERKEILKRVPYFRNRSALD